MQPGSTVEVTINCRMPSETGVWRHYTAGDRFTVVSSSETEAKLCDRIGQRVICPLGRLRVVDVATSPNVEGPGEQPGHEDYELQVQEAIGAFMADRSDLERAINSRI